MKVKLRGSECRLSVHQLNQWPAAAEKKDQSSAIDMFNKLAGVTAGVIVRTALGSARHMVANRHDIAACLDLSIPSQWH